MDASLLSMLFGTSKPWHGPCTVIVDAEASVQTIGTDSIVQGGTKLFAPRLITGRVSADAVRLLPNNNALLLVRKLVIRQHTGEDIINHQLIIVDTAHVVAVEFSDLNPLTALRVDPPQALLAPREPVA
jgi:hypothetical protein